MSQIFSSTAGNHNFDPLAWLNELDAARIVQLHIVGYSVENGRYLDSHAQPIQSEILDLAGEIIRKLLCAP
jgi:uncharacterized protein (UPF0276 family)